LEEGKSSVNDLSYPIATDSLCLHAATILNQQRENQAVEPVAKFHGECKKRQGATSVVPPVQQEDIGL
jgi:hypothetical protein